MGARTTLAAVAAVSLAAAVVAIAPGAMADEHSAYADWVAEGESNEFSGISAPPAPPASAGELPKTGASPTELIALALALIAAGVAAVSGAAVAARGRH